MRDYNFFDPYIEEPEKKSSSGIVFVILAVVLAVVLAIYPLMNQNEIRARKQQITSLKDAIEKMYQDHDFDAIAAQKDQVAFMNAQKDALSQLKVRLDQAFIVDDALLHKVADKTSDGIIFYGINIVGDQVQVEGNATHKIAIAQMEHNLRTSAEFEDIFVPFITEKDGFYDFSISFQIKGGQPDATE